MLFIKIPGFKFQALIFKTGSMLLQEVPAPREPCIKHNTGTNGKTDCPLTPTVLPHVLLKYLLLFPKIPQADDLSKMIVLIAWPRAPCETVSWECCDWLVLAYSVTKTSLASRCTHRYTTTGHTVSLIHGSFCRYQLHGGLVLISWKFPR